MGIKDGKISYYAPTKRARLTRVILIIGLGLFFFIHDLLIILPLKAWSDLITDLIILSAFITTVKFPRTAGIAVLLATIIATLSPVFTIVGGLFAFIAVLVDWAWHSWIHSCLITLFIWSAINGIAFYNLLASGSSLVIGVLAIGAGYTLRVYHENIIDLSQEIQQTSLRAEQTIIELKEQLSAQLHDELAADLSRICMITQSMLEEKPLLSPAQTNNYIKELNTQATSSLLHLREAILALTPASIETKPQISTDLITLLSSCKAMLAVRNINLITEINYEKLLMLPAETMNLIGMLINECATNTMKFADPHEDVILKIRIMKQNVLFRSINQYKATQRALHMSSGRGLILLEDRFRKAGGRIETLQSGGLWILNATLPLSIDPIPEPVKPLNPTTINADIKQKGGING